MLAEGEGSTEGHQRVSNTVEGESSDVEYVLLRVPALSGLKVDLQLDCAVISVSGLDTANPVVTLVASNTDSIDSGDAVGTPRPSVYRGSWAEPGAGLIAVSVEDYANTAVAAASANDSNVAVDGVDAVRGKKMHRIEEAATATVMQRELAPPLRPILHALQTMESQTRRARYSRVIMPSRVLTLDLDAEATLVANGLLRRSDVAS